MIYTIEESLKLSIPTEEKITVLFDLSEFGFYCMDYDAVKMFINILQFNYPEILGLAFIINSPFIFSACWMVCRGRNI
jgi:hypothetical protein